MILWTLQHPSALETLQRDGVYHVDPQRIKFPESEDGDHNHSNYAYRWLCQQMEQRVGPPPEGVEYPIWAWCKVRGSMTVSPI